MKRYGLVLALILMVAPAMFAQDHLNHGEVGAFFNLTRLHHANDTNFYGFGGRVGFNVHSNVQLEAEGAYDFSRNFSINASTAGGGTGGVGSTNTNLRMAHFLFGPKFQIGTGAFRVFGTLKGGLVNFSTEHNLSNQFAGIPSGDTNGVFYPAGGIEMYSGWFGIRAEIGDEMYFDRGANHNLRFTAGPQIRF